MTPLDVVSWSLCIRLVRILGDVCLRRSGCEACFSSDLSSLQVALMGVVPSVIAALDAHRSDEDAVSSGLRLLSDLAKQAENQVSLLS